MMIENLNEATVGEIVASDFRTADLFRKHGIDFCCGGKQTLSDACHDKGLIPELLIRQVEEINMKSMDFTKNFKAWNLGFLCDYIVNTHHNFVKKTLPELIFYTQKIASVHGDNHPELMEVANLMLKINNELLPHIQKEEMVLFPAIKMALTNNTSDTKLVIAFEIERMGEEHEFAGNAMHEIQHLTKNYQPPEDACATYQAALKMLNQFEDDLHIHIHLENNIVFIKAIELTN